jgi:hypothetical protein
MTLPVTTPDDPPAAAAAGATASADEEPLLQRTRHALDIQGLDDGRSSVEKGYGRSRAQTPVASVSITAVLPGGLSPGERRYMVALFTLTAALLYADQNLMAPNLSDIAADFKFNGEQRDRMLGGYIAAAMYLVGEQCRRCRPL